MQEDQFSAAERILFDIESVFKKDRKLKEFDIIHVKINQNKSPVVHVDHCMGLESWCVHHVYSYVYHHIMDYRQQQHRRVDPSVIGRWLLGALLINPDVSTFWNMRKQFVLSDRLDIHSELHYTAVILSRKPKSAEVFAYRKWLSEKLLSLGEAINIDMILNRELDVAELAASRHSNNYHAWTHRTWCLTHFAPKTANLLKVYLDEWLCSEEWIKTHISDHSGLHYRQFLQKQLFKLITESANNPLTFTTQGKELVDRSIIMLNKYVSIRGSPCGINKKCEAQLSDRSNISPLVSLLGIAIAELNLNVDLILRFTDHEALWCHRRFLLTSLKDTLDTAGKDNGEYRCNVGRSKDNLDVCAGNVTAASHKNLDGMPLEKDQKLSHRIECDDERVCRMIRDSVMWNEYLLLDQGLAKDTYQRRLAIQYKNWLSHVVGLDLSQFSTLGVGK